MIDAIINSDQDFTKGYMDEIRVSISDSARWTLLTLLQIQPPLHPIHNTMLLIHSNTTMGSTTFTDSSSSAHTITANGDVMNVAQQDWNWYGSTSQREAGGTDNYLSLAASNDFSWNSYEGFTWEAWVCSTDLGAGGSSGTWGTIFNSSSGGTNYGIGFDASGTVYLWYWDGSSASAAGSTSDLVLNTWAHIAIVKSGTNVLVFFNGVLESTTAITGTPSEGNHVFWIGRNTSSEEFAWLSGWG